VEQGQQGQLIPAQSACGRHAHAVCLQELKEITGCDDCASYEDTGPGNNRNAASFCRAAAVEYLRAIRSTSTGTPARFVVTERCLCNLHHALALDAGHGNSLTLLGVMHQSGLGVPLDEIKAYQCFLKAHESGTPLGTLYLARCYKRGLGCNIDLVKARTLLAEADVQGKQMATLELALMCRAGLGGEVDFAKAVKLLMKADLAGDALAAYELGMAYANEKMDLPKNLEKARTHMEAACHRGYLLAVVELSQMYMMGIGGPQDTNRARELTMAVDFPKPHHPSEIVDEKALTHGWLSSRVQELYITDLEKLDPNEWWQLRVPDPEEEDPNAMLKAMGLYTVPAKITTSGPFAARPTVEPPPGSEPGGLWRATMAFHGIKYGDSVVVSAEQAVSATGRRVVVEIKEIGVSIIAEYVLPREYDDFMCRNPELDETSSIKSCTPFGGISSRLREWMRGSSRARRPRLNEHP